MSRAASAANSKVLTQIDYQLKDYAKVIEYGKSALRARPADPDLIAVPRPGVLPHEGLPEQPQVMDGRRRQARSAAASRRANRIYRIHPRRLPALKDDACVDRAVRKAGRSTIRSPSTGRTWSTRCFNDKQEHDKQLLNIMRLATHVGAMNEPLKFDGDGAARDRARACRARRSRSSKKGINKKCIKSTRDRRARQDAPGGCQAAAAAATSRRCDKQDASARAKPPAMPT